MKKGLRRMYIAFLSPVVIAFLFAYLYPVLRTVQMSFFKLSDVSASRDTWEFVGLYNYCLLYTSRRWKTGNEQRRSPGMVSDGKIYFAKTGIPSMKKSILTRAWPTATGSSAARRAPVRR